MSKTAATRTGRKRAIARLRAIKRRAAAFKRGTRKLLTMMLVAAFVADGPMVSHAQVGSGMIGGASGQGAMAPVGGLVNSGIARFRELEANGPGWMYWGLNAADRGLGYQGSYMTLGGFIPYAEDDLGGIWSADLRSHLSNYGGFFSNVGLVRKQFFGGAIGGIGVYWDYDGDQNQYADTTITDTSGSYIFAGGQSYNQVGVSGEFLTDYGNLRSNGYIPVGTTAQTMGPFVGNSLLCTPGINAALTGADLEVGAYLPGLADWAGMVSVGGYAFGNSRYDLVGGQDVIPWFGGVYTRLDLTLIRNWDFSLQYNNDSYFDSTGFARLTYRMGGSRRRNVPDQMEQPMMRNEHIVRAHQAPEQAINPANNLPWVVYHVDNSTSVAPGGTGTVERPFRTLSEGETNAANPYDIVFVHLGQSSTTPYETPANGYQFRADNQYLVGEGTSLRVPSVNCGQVALWAQGTSPNYPVIAASGTGNGIAINLGGSRTNSTIDHLRITNSPVGISSGTAGLQVGAIANVNDVQIVGTAAGQRGIELSGTAGTFNLTSLSLSNLTRDGIAVLGSGTGSTASDIQVNLTNSKINNTTGSGILVQNVTGTAGRLRVVGSEINGSTGAGIFVGNANAFVGTSTFSTNGLAGVYVQDSAPSTTTLPAVPGNSVVQVADSKFSRGAVGVWALADSGTTNVTITNNRISTTSSPSGANGVMLSVSSGTQGRLNARVVGNEITPKIITSRVTNTTVTSTSGTGTGTVVTTSSTATTTYSSLGNILLTTTGSASPTGFSPNSKLYVQAADQDQLQSLNRASGVATVPLPLTTGSTTIVPPPPIYDAALPVPLPPP
jgi:hypothetical protein